jgi:hypothetical protein
MRSITLTPFALVAALAFVAGGCAGLPAERAHDPLALPDAAPCSVMMGAPFAALSGSYTNGGADNGTCQASTAGDTLAIAVRAGSDEALVRLPLAGVVVNDRTSVEELTVALSGAHCAAWDGVVDLSQPLPGWRIWIELGCRDNPALELHIAAQEGTDRPYQ